MQVPRALGCERRVLSADCAGFVTARVTSFLVLDGSLWLKIDCMQTVSVAIGTRFNKNPLRPKSG